MSASAACGQPTRPPKPPVELPQYRFYAGLAYSIQAYQTTSLDGGIHYIRVVGVEPVYAYAGYQFNPYLAGQVGFCQRKPLTEDGMQNGVLRDGRTYTSLFHRYFHDAAVPV